MLTSRIIQIIPAFDNALWRIGRPANVPMIVFNVIIEIIVVATTIPAACCDGNTSCRKRGATAPPTTIVNLIRHQYGIFQANWRAVRREQTGCNGSH